MKIIKKSGDILGGILMVVSLILLIPLFLTNMGINSYIILSGSMEPVIRTGSMVLVDIKRKIFKWVTLLCIGCRRKTLFTELWKFRKMEKLLQKVTTTRMQILHQ